VKSREKIGEPFNPYKRFSGPMIPEALSRCRTLKAGAKLVYGCLRRFAGQDGRCYPSMDKIALETGYSEEQARRYIRALEQMRLIRAIGRFTDSSQTSNDYLFLWHEIFEQAAVKPSNRVSEVTALSLSGATAGPLSDPTAPQVSDVIPKEGQSEEGQSEEGIEDPDCRNRNSSDCRPVGQCEQFPTLKRALTLYMNPKQPGDPPSEREVTDIMDAAEGATEAEVVGALIYLWKQRGLSPGTQNGPRCYSWFVTVIGNHFRKKREREDAANPDAEGWKERNEAKVYR
jgi:hypothetical protein